jgi:hypothetical protein
VISLRKANKREVKRYEAQEIFGAAPPHTAKIHTPITLETCLPDKPLVFKLQTRWPCDALMKVGKSGFAILRRMERIGGRERDVTLG